MRIISKFKDYYDAAGLGYGIDISLVYQRNTEDRDISTLPEYIKLNEYLKGLPISRINNTYSLLPGVIGFCGKLYPVYDYYDKSSFTHIYFTDFRRFAYINNEPNPNLPLSFFNQKKSKINPIYFINKVEEWTFELAEKNNSGFINEDIFHVLNAPIFIMWKDDSYLTINPYLKPFNFQYYFEPLSAFNELSMFIPLLTQKQIDYTVGDDKVIAQSKGHSFSSSFRYVPPNKKERRRLNKAKDKLDKDR